MPEPRKHEAGVELSVRLAGGGKISVFKAELNSHGRSNESIRVKDSELVHRCRPALSGTAPIGGDMRSASQISFVAASSLGKWPRVLIILRNCGCHFQWHSWWRSLCVRLVKTQGTESRGPRRCATRHSPVGISAPACAQQAQPVRLAHSGWYRSGESRWPAICDLSSLHS